MVGTQQSMHEPEGRGGTGQYDYFGGHDIFVTQVLAVMSLPEYIVADYNLLYK